MFWKANDIVFSGKVIAVHDLKDSNDDTTVPLLLLWRANGPSFPPYFFPCQSLPLSILYSQTLRFGRGAFIIPARLSIGKKRKEESYKEGLLIAFSRCFFVIKSLSALYITSKNNYFIVQKIRGKYDSQTV